MTNPESTEPTLAEIELQDEIREFLDELRTTDASLHARFNDVLSAGARYLEENLHSTEQNSAKSGDYTTQSRGARDKAELLARMMKTDADRAKDARERAERALDEAENGSARVSAIAEASANASATAGGGHIVESTPAQDFAPRPADPLVVTMGQLSTLLIGSSPAFANAMRLQTDAVASGMGNLNAIANQQAHYTLDLAATARAVAEAYTSNKSDTHIHLAVIEPPAAAAPTTAKK